MASTRGARPTRRSGRPSTTSTATSVTPTASRVTTRAAASPTSTTSSGQDVGKAPKLKVRARRGDGGGGERRRDAGEMVTIPGRSLTVQTPGRLAGAGRQARRSDGLPARANERRADGDEPHPARAGPAAQPRGDRALRPAQGEGGRAFLHHPGPGQAQGRGLRAVAARRRQRAIL